MSELSGTLSYIFVSLKLIKNYFVYSLLAAYPLIFVDKANAWIIANQDYITIVTGTIIISHIFGTYVHILIKKDFSIGKNLAGLCLKITVVTGVVLLFEGFSHVTIYNEFFYKYIQMTLRLLTLIYPLRSALLNCYLMTGGTFPPSSVIKRIDKFQQTLDIETFKNKKEE